MLSYIEERKPSEIKSLIYALCFFTYVVPRASSHKKFKSLSFFEPSNASYPSPPLSKQSGGISLAAHLDSETHLLRACNHEFFPLVELNDGDLNSKQCR